jgi:hypothetical protein
MRWPALLVALAGCNGLLGLDPAHEPDAFVAPGCSGSRFTGPFELTSLTGPTTWDPSQGDDPLELIVSIQDEATNLLHINRATRPDTASAYTLVPLPFTDPSFEDHDPSITAHGARLLFLSNRVDGAHLWEALRDSTGTFSNPAIVTSVEPFDAGLDMSIDGLTIYYADTRGNPPTYPLFTASRPSLDEPFGSPMMLLADGIRWPSISPDQLELYYLAADDTSIHRRVRPAIDAPFGPDEPVAPGVEDPDVSADARTLLVSNFGQLQYMTRACP